MSHGAFTAFVVLHILVIVGVVLWAGLTEPISRADAAALLTALFTGSIAAAAWLGLWPAARQARLAAQAEELAARASAESHRPYLTVETRPSIEGFLYLDLVNHGDRAALDIALSFSPPTLQDSTSIVDAAAPFGAVSYLAPSEGRSVVYSNSQDAGGWPTELIFDIRYIGEDGKSHEATITHNLDALKVVLINRYNARSPQQLLRDGLQGLERIVTNAIRRVLERDDEPSTDPSD